MKMVSLAILALFTTKKKNFVGLTAIDPTIGLLMNKKKFGERLNENWSIWEMLTKEECEQALENIANLELQEYEGLYGRIKLVGDIRFNEYRVLRRLIKEHFEDKKALRERFDGHKGEKLKDNPWGDELVD